MKNGVNKLSPAIFGIAIICFFLPFVNFTCQGTKVASLTGIQLVTGTTVQQPSILGQRGKAEKVNPEPLAIITLLCTVFGLVLSFIRDRRSHIVPSILGVVSVILLLVIKTKFDSEVLREGGGMVQVGYDSGFWLTFLFSLCAAVLNGFLFSQREKQIG